MSQSHRPQSDRLTVYNVDAFLAHIGVERPAAREPVTLDLRRLGFVDLFAMAAIACMCADLESDGVPVHLVLSEDGACGFLQRAGFFDMLPSAVVLQADLPPARLNYIRAFRGANPGLLEFTRIDSGQAIRGRPGHLSPRPSIPTALYDRRGQDAGDHAV
jgi:hypothetical protein